MKKLFIKTWRTIKLRLEQEEIIFRYAIYCKERKLTKSLLIIRPLIIIISLIFISYCIFSKQITVSSESPIHIIFWASYIAILSNYKWKTGNSKEIITRTKWTVVALLFLQILTLSDIAVSQTRIRGTQPNITITQSTQPGKIFSYTKAEDTKLIAKGIKVSRGIQITGAGNISYSMPETVTVQETQEALLTETDNGPPTILESPLNYPNPFSLRRDNGTEVGFRISKAVEVEIRVYDTFANEIFRESITTNSGNKYTRITLDSAAFGVTDLASGIYYYVLIYEGKVIGKGKIAVIP